jgi:hypothetical protein
MSTRRPGRAGNRGQCDGNRGDEPQGCRSGNALHMVSNKSGISIDKELQLNGEFPHRFGPMNPDTQRVIEQFQPLPRDPPTLRS